MNTRLKKGAARQSHRSQGGAMQPCGAAYFKANNGQLIVLRHFALFEAETDIVKIGRRN